MVYEAAVALSGPFPEALDRVKAALAAEGFGVLTEIDLRSTLKEKLDRDIDPYVILGACNPELAAQAVAALPQIGVLLPCNVVVRESGSEIMVEAMDPGLLATITDREEVSDIADEARRRIGDALGRLTDAS